MSKRPPGPQYRGLSLRGKTIWFQDRSDGRSIRASMETDDWDVAARRRQATLDRVSRRDTFGSPGTFGEACERYWATTRIAPTTRADRESMIGKAGHIRAHFDRVELDAIDEVAMLEWFAATKAAFRERGGREASRSTLANYLNAIAGVFQSNPQVDNPVPAFRSKHFKQDRTRAASMERRREIRAWPVAELAAFLEQSRREGSLLSMLLAHTGLRLGEGTALKWEDVHWGRDEGDETRHLHIQRSQSRNGEDGPTKTGKSRKVALARDLRRVLLREWGRPGRDPVYVCREDHSNWRRRDFARFCRKAGLGPRRVKDLRATFASLLVTAGVQAPYVQHQLGHSSLQTTFGFYATWTEDGYVRPPEVGPGEVPADLVGRLTQSLTQSAAREASGDA